MGNGLFKEVSRDLKTHGLILRDGSVVNATNSCDIVLAEASSRVKSSVWSVMLVILEFKRGMSTGGGDIFWRGDSAPEFRQDGGKRAGSERKAKVIQTVSKTTFNLSISRSLSSPFSHRAYVVSRTITLWPSWFATNAGFIPAIRH